MPPPTQDNSNLAINTVLGKDKVLIVNATISEQLGRLFQMEVLLKSDDTNISFDTIVGSNATIRLELLHNKTPRFFNGFVNRFVQLDADSKGSTYRATLVPWLWFLTRTADCRIFQNKSVPDIIKQVFRDHGFTDFKEKLNGTYTAWENCVQYRETDFNFVSRLMEHEGIYYFFEHVNGKHTLVLADSISSHQPFPGYEEIGALPSRGGTDDTEYISNWVVEQEVQPGSYAVNDFNFEKPKTSLLAKSDKPREHPQSQFEIFDYPGEYEEHAEGVDYSKIRIEEIQTQHKVVRGQTDARGLASGCTFSLTGAARRDQNQKYLVTSASYHLTGDTYYSGGGGGGGEHKEALYSCSFAAIISSEAFRAARVSPKPLIQGPQTAIVVGPKGEEIHTDKYGRVKVFFHWDRHGKADENSSCWVRVSQSAWAGKKWGAMAIPRVGHEVVVEFLEGDPDLPLVTGQLYNAESMPPYDLPANKTRTTLKTNSTKGGSGFNELRFEDKKGSEQIFIHAERNHDLRIKSDAFESVGHDKHLTVRHDQLELIQGDKHQEVKGEHNQKIGETLSINAGQHIQTKAGTNVGLEAGAEMHLKAGTNVVIETSVEITLKGGGGFITIGPSGVVISGAMVLINSGGAAGSGAGISPTPPKAAKAADDAVTGSKGSASGSPGRTKATSTSPTSVALKQAAQDGTPFCEQCAASVGTAS